jgi:alpha-galactosidase
MIKTWRLDTNKQTLVLGAEENRIACVIYWGGKLPASENLDTLYRAHVIDVTGGMLDANPDLSICPEATQNFPGQVGMILHDTTGDALFPEFRFDKAIEEPSSLSLHYCCQEAGISYVASFHSFADTNIFTAQASITAEKSLRLNWLSAPVIPAAQSAVEMIDYAGRWCGEFQEVRTNWAAGARLRESRTGRTGHEHFPGLVVPDAGANHSTGGAYAFHYGWSGGHRMIAEELPDGRRQVQFGNASNIEFEAGNQFETATLYLSYSDQGTNGCARAFQRHVRQHVVKFSDSKRPRPVHYNCWEAVYFDHNVEELKDIAIRAAKLGAERFVLDDGWFGTRDDDTRALSEWEVDPRKYPNGLGPLIDHVHSEKMTFGIWFEPEMINPKSTVYEAHPNWVLGTEDQILGRNQMVLNMAMPEVRGFLYDRISKILTDYDIDYIKWDHNRVLPMPDAAQTRGTYDLLDRLGAAFPNVEIESCASGGGRIDYGILQRTQRVWLSDSNDALERARIQHGSAMFLPSCVTGSHVGPRTSHTSGRTHDMSFRAWIAAQRHMGFEMDPRELTDEEAEILTRVTAWWRAERDWLMAADILRLNINDPSVLGELHLSNDEQQFVVFANKIDSSLQIVPRPMCLTGLDPSKNYHISLVNREQLHHLSRGKTILKFDDITLSGQYLMQQGITLPWSFPNQTWVIKGKLQE